MSVRRSGVEVKPYEVHGQAVASWLQWPANYSIIEWHLD